MESSILSLQSNWIYSTNLFYQIKLNYIFLIYFFLFEMNLFIYLFLFLLSVSYWDTSP